MEKTQRVGLLLLTASLLLGPIQVCANAQWLEAKGAHYLIFYKAGSEPDVAFTRKWLDRAEQLMKTKYGVSPDHYSMSVYLYPAPADEIDINRSGHITCCTESKGVSTGTIKLLALSAPVWQSGNLKSSLGL